MAVNEASQSQQSTRPALIVPRSEAAEKIKKQIDKGRELMEQSMSLRCSLFPGDEHRDRAKTECNKWSSYNVELLKTLFSDDSFATGYAQVNAFMAATAPNDLRKRIEKNVARLESILGRLDLIPETTHVSQIEQNPPAYAVVHTEKWYQNRTIQAALITGVFMLLAAILTTPLWIPFITRAFGESHESASIPESGETGKVPSPKTVPSSPNTPSVNDDNSPILQKSEQRTPHTTRENEGAIEPEERNAEVNRPEVSPIIRIPEETIAPEETDGNVDRIEKKDLIRKEEQPIKPEEN